MGYLFSLVKVFQARYRFYVISMVSVVLALSAHGVAATPAYGVTIEVDTNGYDADSAPGPEIILGSPITWTYTVTNTGSNDFRKVDIYDREPGLLGLLLTRTKVCTIDNLLEGESASCTLDGIAEEGQYANIGIAIAKGRTWLQIAIDQDRSHYVGTLGHPAIDLEKATEGQDADASPGPELNVDDPVEWTFLVSNTGDVDLSNVVVTDEAVQPVAGPESTVCEIATLPVGQSESCSMSGSVIEGQYQNIGRVVADGLGGAQVGDEDVSHYSGVVGNALSALPSAVPTSGDAPLAVMFTPNALTNNAIVRYEWDFEGDGTYDRSETVGRDQSFTYTAPGNYSATLRVTDNTGDTATGSVVIAVGNKGPEVSVDLVPSNGQVPLVVNFMASATDSDGIAQFEWDYDGDGLFDETTTAGSTTFTYEVEGSFQARVRVTDNFGAQTTLTIPTLEINALPVGSPTVSLAASPNTGNAPLTVTMTATASDVDGGTIDQYEWDVDGDGNYDEITTVNTLSHTYSAIGSFFARVRVTDSSGLQSEDVVGVFVEPQFDLSVSTDTVDPQIGETVSVLTTLGGDTEVSLVIEAKNGQLVRTLVPFELRLAGDYSDDWDGTDESGEIVTEGEYRAILLYRLDGVDNRIDLALSTGGVQSSPPRSGIPSSFSPFAGDPLDITFTLNRASEVTAFMGLFNINTRLVTFLQREPLGRGTHTIIWNGENSDGQLVEAPPGESFLFGIFAYTLPDNAVYIRSGVHVNSVSASPSIYQPTRLNEDGSPVLSQIEIELSRSGSARLVINELESGVQVAEFTFDNLTAGANTLPWDGRDNNGTFVAPGSYRLGVSGLDERGYESMTVYTLQRIFY